MPKNLLGNFGQVFGGFFSHKIDNIVDATRGDFWRKKGAGKMVKLTSKFFGMEY